jgi:hypothetical protein
MAVLKVKGNDPDRELDFELRYLRSLSTQQRFELMFRRSREIAELMAKRGHRRTPKITKRS